MAKNVRVAINGFGRIGRLAFRQMFGAKGYEIVAINDLTDSKMLAHLLKYDSAQGRYALADKVEAKEGAIVVDGKEIKIYAEKNAADLPWKEIGVDVVLECTGFYTSKAKAQAHIDAGAKKVVISAPAGNDLPTIVYSVNEKTLTKEDTIISAASCTTNCLAPMAAALNKLAPIESGIMSTIHAYTGDQMVPPSCPRRRNQHRAQQHRRRQGYRPRHPRTQRQTYRLRSARSRVLRFHHHSRRDLQRQCDRRADQRRNEGRRFRVSESYGYNEDQIVSSDVIGMTYGSLFDATQTMVKYMPEIDCTQVQVVSWYDNENSYTSQMVRTIKYFAEL